MNRMELVPSTATQFVFEQRMERLGRCAHLNAQLAKCETFAQEIIAANVATRTKTTRLLYVHGIKRKLQQQHTDVHLCWPFSRN